MWTRSVKLFCFFILALGTLFFVGCGRSESGSGSGSVVALTPAQQCSTAYYADWTAQRACLVSSYQSDVNRCLAVADAVQRAQCVQLVRGGYVGANAGVANAWGDNWSLYTTAADPYYQSLATYNANWAYRYQADIWATYYRNALASDYYNRLYLTNYNLAYANYWGRPGYYYYY